MARHSRIAAVAVLSVALAWLATSGASQSVAATTPDLSAVRGRVIVIDPGHNGANWSHPATINRQVFVVTKYKACDTTGTSTNAGYSETAFTWDVASRLAHLLRVAGATVILTRPNNHGVGPCITERAAIGNRAHAAVAISIHADGGPPGGVGFHVILPGNVGPNKAIIAPSHRLGVVVRNAFHAVTGEPTANYVATKGLITRTDVGGLNLSKVPKVLIECGNMRNSADARRLSTPSWREQAAMGLAQALATYLKVT